VSGCSGRARVEPVLAVELGVAGDELMPGTLQVLFEMPVAQPQRATWYDVSIEAAAFVVRADEVLTHVTVIFGFFDQVRRMLAGHRVVALAIGNYRTPDTTADPDLNPARCGSVGTLTPDAGPRVSNPGNSIGECVGVSRASRAARREPEY
jgi:hypothetical protein